MNSRNFLKTLFKSGLVEKEDIIKFVIKNYYLKGLTLEDFRQDLIEKYKTGEIYANALIKDFKKVLVEYSR